MQLWRDLLRKRHIEKPQYIAMPTHGGVVEIALQPGRWRLWPGAAQRAAVKSLGFVGIQNDQTQVVDAGQVLRGAD